MIGIIGGTGISSILNKGEEKIISTKYGNSKVLIDNENDTVLLFRHGAEHNTPPHKINYLANIYALKTLGVDRILALSCVGSLRDDVIPGDFFIPYDFLEFTKLRKSTFYDGDDGKVAHVDASEPYCLELQKITKEILKKRNYKFDEGVYVCTEGPRFETKTEIQMYKPLGHVVGMTAYPEVVLAREMEICYTSICNVSNYATGISKNILTVDEVLETLKEMEEKILNVLNDFITYDFKERTCFCKSALKNAIM
ncbi:purine phosphorylase family 2 [Methanococcus vannielii SB]|jgi:5'-methylthioadenosine phosphorylase|uniref:Probable S-methyl-5'-thioinosine phosphorylase n=1 Tax=Methanococcus vannielii (strain ATCC 35089 / DSM 1224 / JCM 13029 / OCM 148 / SB) TaxID=406327 RepID=A6URG3_METVS|nr:MTAP family purine nucleoside phosphorylase [Methanococcus vannielii]ABR55085.1 purine phosphorylase family 2 [Methanococcus vannielii SB]